MQSRFQAVKKQLWTDILRGRFGQKLPPEPELAKLYEVSRMTLRRSIAELTGEGFLEAKPGQGTFVMQERRVRHSSRTIGLLVAFDVLQAVAEPYFGAIFTALAVKLAAEDYMLTFARSPDQLVSATPTVGEKVLRRPVDGIVAAAFDQDYVWQIAGLRVPLVLADCSPLPERSCVLPDNRAGMAAAVLHLVALGHQRIAHIAGTATIINGQERLLCWREAMGRHGLAADDTLLAQGRFTVESGHQAMGRLCDASGGRPTAVICGNDRMALGAMRCLAERGLRVPDDVSIVGFDDIDTAAYTSPPLTTVRVPSIDFAETVCRILIEDIGVPVSERSGRTIRVPAQLVIRGSTGLVPAHSRKP